MNILDPRFNYVPSYRTDIRETWKKHGFEVGRDERPRDGERQSRERDGYPVREAGSLRLP